VNCSCPAIKVLWELCLSCESSRLAPAAAEALLDLYSGYALCRKHVTSAAQLEKVALHELTPVQERTVLNTSIWHETLLPLVRFCQWRTLLRVPPLLAFARSSISIGISVAACTWSLELRVLAGLNSVAATSALLFAVQVHECFCMTTTKTNHVFRDPTRWDRDVSRARYGLAVWQNVSGRFVSACKILQYYSEKVLKQSSCFNHQ